MLTSWRPCPSIRLTPTPTMTEYKLFETDNGDVDDSDGLWGMGDRAQGLD